MLAPKRASAASSTQHAARSTQHTTRSTQHAAHNTQHTARRAQPASAAQRHTDTLSSEDLLADTLTH
eukprot:3036037-Alexandrium_andersonii.AAC.1